MIKRSEPVKARKGITVVVNGGLSFNAKRTSQRDRTDRDVMVGFLIDHHEGKLKDKSWADVICTLREYGVDFQIFDV